jgi:hypothetical protein
VPPTERPRSTRSTWKCLLFVSRTGRIRRLRRLHGLENESGDHQAHLIPALSFVLPAFCLLPSAFCLLPFSCLFFCVIGVICGYCFSIHDLRIVCSTFTGFVDSRFTIYDSRAQ